MEATRVWAISSGEYSDYGVRVLFPTKELAEGHLAQLQGTPDDGVANRGAYWHREAFVEEFRMLDSLPEIVETFTGIAVIRKRGGTEETMHSAVGFDYAGIATQSRPLVEIDDLGDGIVRIEITGSKKDEVEKALYERVAHVKAERASLAP